MAQYGIKTRMNLVGNNAIEQFCIVRKTYNNEWNPYPQRWFNSLAEARAVVTECKKIDEYEERIIIL